MMSGFGHFALAMAGQRRTVGRTVRDLQTTFSAICRWSAPRLRGGISARFGFSVRSYSRS